MKQNISLQELIAINNPSKAKALIVKYGYKPARNYNDLIYKLFRLTKEHREDALKDLVEIHPHKNLIIHFTEIESNCDGQQMCPVCKEKEQQKNMSFEGTINEPIVETKQLPKNTNATSNINLISVMPIIAITSLITATMITLFVRPR
jgi:hypothetical protein